MKIHVIGDKNTVLGFRLTGVEGTAASNAEEARRALDSAVKNDEIGLLLITRQWRETLGDRVDDLRMHSLHPVVMEIPGQQLSRPPVSIRQLVRKAVGLRMD